MLLTLLLLEWGAQGEGSPPPPPAPEEGVGRFTFQPYLLVVESVTMAHGPVLGVTRVKDRFGNLVAAQPGDYVIKDPDGRLWVMPGELFEAEYTAI